MNVTSEIQEDIIPNNILMIGHGVGKTEIARRPGANCRCTVCKSGGFQIYRGRLWGVTLKAWFATGGAIGQHGQRKKEEVKEKAAAAVETLFLMP